MVEMDGDVDQLTNQKVPFIKAYCTDKISAKSTATMRQAKVNSDWRIVQD